MAAKEQPREDDAEPGRIFACAKSNIGPEDGAFRYRLRSVALHEHPGVEAGAIEWLGAIAGSARDILAEVEGSHDEEATTAHSEAEAFLFDLLAEGPVETKEIKRRAGEAGHAWRTLKRAKSSLNIVARKDGMSGGWAWRLPEGGQEPSKEAREKRWPSSEKFVPLREKDEAGA